jgi:hypothetical protein
VIRNYQRHLSTGVSHILYFADNDGLGCSEICFPCLLRQLARAQTIPRKDEIMLGRSLHDRDRLNRSRRMERDGVEDRAHMKSGRRELTDRGTFDTSTGLS